VWAPCSPLCLRDSRPIIQQTSSVWYCRG
jgi:hypothetical protein